MHFGGTPRSGSKNAKKPCGPPGENQTFWEITDKSFEPGCLLSGSRRSPICARRADQHHSGNESLKMLLPESYEGQKPVTGGVQTIGSG
jgi:hypothetical protein